MCLCQMGIGLVGTQATLLRRVVFLMYTECRERASGRIGLCGSMDEQMKQATAGLDVQSACSQTSPPRRSCDHPWGLWPAGLPFLARNRVQAWPRMEIVSYSKFQNLGGTWVAQLVGCLTLAHVVISWLVGPSLTSGFGLTAQGLLWIFCLPLSLPLPLSQK